MIFMRADPEVAFEDVAAGAEHLKPVRVVVPNEPSVDVPTPLPLVVIASSVDMVDGQEQHPILPTADALVTIGPKAEILLVKAAPSRGHHQLIPLRGPIFQVPLSGLLWMLFPPPS